VRVSEVIVQLEAGPLEVVPVEGVPLELEHDVECSDDAEELGWQDRALCAQTDPEAFFPEKGGSTREAKKVCRSCEVRAECLEFALENDERFGIWGGMSERERRRLKKEAV
jgi:WhiB family redox-sensing transcriptional regulator